MSRTVKRIAHILSIRESRRRAFYWLLMTLRCRELGVRFPLTISILGSFYVFKHPEAEISIGDYVRIVNHLKFNPAGVIHPTVLRAEVPGAKITIGDYVGMSGAIICAETSVTIGDHCLLGANCAIYDTDYHPIDYFKRRINDLTAVKRAPVTIGDDCWIGANAVILKGVTIGSRSVVGANSVVTCDIPPDSVAAGNPARVVSDLSRV